MKSTTAAIAVAMVALLAIAGFSVYFLLNQGGGKTSTTTGSVCWPGQKVTKSQVADGGFGGLTEWYLPSPARWVNAITAAPDGSVWFGEESVPGVAHLFRNGTLLEYPWPTSGWRTTVACDYRTGIWGIQVWNGMVWAADQDENAVIGLNQQTGKATVLNVTSKAPSPYSLAPSPDGSLWFTSLSATARLGKIAPDLSVNVYPVNGLNGEVPVQVDFVNASYAYFVAINQSSKNYSPYGHLYAFDPQSAASGITPNQVGGSFKLLEPTSVSAYGSRVWVTQHGASSVAVYDTHAKTWTVFPTSTETFTSTTLPYFVEATPDGVWFNEHYANRIAFLNASAGTLTEYSEANPPVLDGSLIQNDLTIAQGKGGLWFTSTTGNYIGFINGSYRNPFSLRAANGTTSMTVSPGSFQNLFFQATGNSSGPLQIKVSSSELYTSVPKLLTVTPNVQSIQPSANTSSVFQVTITAQSTLQPGTYTVAVSVTDGLVTKSVYLSVTVA